MGHSRDAQQALSTETGILKTSNPSPPNQEALASFLIRIHKTEPPTTPSFLLAGLVAPRIVVAGLVLSVRLAVRVAIPVAVRLAVRVTGLVFKSDKIEAMDISEVMNIPDFTGILFDKLQKCYSLVLEA
ncbi:hypothetical protein PIB30_083477 [Stylosanthes scabra]|uniref:Uncharacterized protein n=1 Tax=Stylosanthes scabra TaxID=79078 RepID=A0ABU6QRT4_9FABA|nr:hypothetical protein [Stylosanthes scabra]